MDETVLMSRFYTYRWWLFAIVSLMFFLNTAATYASLGVALPYMIQDLGWSRAEAGTGFSLLALATGLAAPAPALFLRKFGIKVTYAAGGLLLVVGGVLLATTTSLTQYYVAAAFMGVGVSLCGGVPGVHLVNTWLPDKQSFAIGAFYMIGGLGGVAGPLIVTSTTSLTGSWHAHWWTMAGSLLLISIIATFFLKELPATIAEKLQQAQSKKKRNESQKVHRSEQDWRFAQTIRTPQFYIITFSLTLILLSAVTMNTWAFTHMMTLGITSATAATVLSLQAVVNSISRVIGGSLANFIDPKWLLASALLADVIGMSALSYSDSPFALALFILGDGYGFGMCFFASTMLLVNYYGSKASPEILSSMNFITTLAMVGPVLAGMASDNWGGFTWVFRICALALLVFMFVVIAMKPPKHKQIEANMGDEKLGNVPI
jgi:MFS transporter, OFA family, oxalate/formate antiporter